MTAFSLGTKIKGNLQDSILKYASHVRVLMGVTSNGKIKKNANQAKENFSRRAVAGGGIKREKKLDLCSNNSMNFLFSWFSCRTFICS